MQEEKVEIRKEENRPNDDLVDKIREECSDPVTALKPHETSDNSTHEGEYCVGGALAIMSGKSPNYAGGHFPGIRELGSLMRDWNPRLPVNLSHNLAGMITTANDDGDFEDAWNTLDEALNWTRG